MEDRFFRALDKGRILERIAADAPEQINKATGERTVFREIEDLEGLFQDYAEANAEVMEEAARRAFNAAGKRTAASLGASISFDLKNPDVLERLARRANMLSGDVADDTFSRIMETIAEKFWEEREGIDAVAKALEEEFQFLNVARAKRIAHQETLVAVEEATQESFERNGIKKKQWLASIGNPTPPRPSHLEAHLQIVAVDEPFSVGGEDLMHPGDPSASLEETMGCRCAESAVIEEPLSPDDFWDGS